jgi:hypothetical protein
MNENNELREVEPCDQVAKEYSPNIKSFDTELDLLKNHNVTFNFLDAGCTISVGCKTYAFSDFNVALEEFNNYVKNPAKAYVKWRGNN